MSTSVSRGLRFSSLALRMEEEAKASEPQGIGSILGSVPEIPKTAASLRRTLSADMSSRKWLAQHGFSPLKKIASSEGFPVVSSTASDSSSSSSFSEGEEEEEEQAKKELEIPGRLDVCSSIQSEQQKKEVELSGLFDIWGSILSQNAEDSSKTSSAPTPYIHPLVNKSKSSLSEKSLEICTESLGSETGSDGFSSYPSSETGDFEENAEEEEDVEETEQVSQASELRTVNYNCSVSRKPPSGSFPPPLPSLSRRDGPSLHIRSHRRDGRLVLEAVPIPSYNNYFHAERQGGRLLLRFVKNTPFEEPSNIETDEEEIEDVDEEEDELEKEEEAEELDDEEIEKVEKENGFNCKRIVTEVVVSEASAKLPTGLINVHRSVMKNIMCFTPKNPTWSHKLNKLVNHEEKEDEEPPPLLQSLPSPPRVARLISSPSAAAAAAVAAASFNAYEYRWRTKPAVAAVTKHALTQPPPQPINNNHNNFIFSRNLRPQGQQQQLLLLRGNKADCLVPLFSGCKDSDSKISLFIRQPRCIATS